MSFSEYVHPLLWWPYVSRLNFNAYHLSRIGYRSDWKDLSISTLEFPKTRFYLSTKLWRRIQSLDLKVFVVVSGGMIRRQIDIWYAFVMSSHDSILDRETKLRRASSHIWRLCRRSKCSLLFEDAFFKHMKMPISGKNCGVNRSGQLRLNPFRISFVIGGDVRL